LPASAAGFEYAPDMFRINIGRKFHLYSAWQFYANAGRRWTLRLNLQFHERTFVGWRN
jgi:hypothetical protein